MFFSTQTPESVRNRMVKKSPHLLLSSASTNFSSGSKYSQITPHTIDRNDFNKKNSHFSYQNTSLQIRSHDQNNNSRYFASQTAVVNSFSFPNSQSYSQQQQKQISQSQEREQVYAKVFKYTALEQRIPSQQNENKQCYQNRPLERKQQSYEEERQRNIRLSHKGVTSFKDKGFLSEEQNELLLSDGQTFIRSRKILIDSLFAVIVVALVYIMYRFNCSIFDTRLPQLLELKALLALVIALVSKIITFTHKLKITINFYVWILIGFTVDCLATQFYIDGLTSYFFAYRLNVNIKNNLKDYFVVTLSILCTLIFYMENRFIERNDVDNVNHQIKTIVKQSISEEMRSIVRNIQYACLSILFSCLGALLSGEHISKLFTSRPDIHSPTITRNIFLIFAFSLSQIIIFSFASRLIINFKSQYHWNFLSDTHDIHKIQHFYFVLAHKKLNDQMIEVIHFFSHYNTILSQKQMKTLKFWQSNFNNAQTVNIMRQINIEGEKTCVWNIFLRHGIHLKERLTQFKIDNVQLFEDYSQIEKNIPKLWFWRYTYLFMTARVYLRSLSSEKELMYLLEMICYSIQNLTNTVLAFHEIKDYKELFSSTYTIEIIQEYMVTYFSFSFKSYHQNCILKSNHQIYCIYFHKQSVFTDMIEMKTLFNSHKQYNLIYKRKLIFLTDFKLNFYQNIELLSKISLLIEISNDQRLFNATIRTLISSPESFYQSS